jgi:tRNA threonylcarbamoyl adenosine modification protein (Sua5/YciO/YrdC/YwlC family)
MPSIGGIGPWCAVRDDRGMDVVVEALRRGDVVVIPTETVYGLAALPAVPGATAKIFALKGRTADVPLAVLCADARQALDLADDPSDAVQRVAKAFWPGPLTLVLRRRPGLGYELGEPATTVGVRCPDHDLVRAIAAQVGPIATTSANLHGQPTPDTAAGIAKLFGDGVAAVVDGGRCDGVPSTVVDATADGWRVLRQGSIDLGDLRQA